MKIRSCFVSNSSSSSFIVHDMDAATMKEKAIECCKEFILEAMKPSERDRPNADAIAEKRARTFFDNPSNVKFFNFGSDMKHSQWKRNVRELANFSYADYGDAELYLEQEYVFPDSPERIALMVDAENALIRYFGYAGKEGEEISVMEALREELGSCYPIRMT